ncbi:uncharacterized protein LY79DRAFT_407428 [Colletotrichum navitas]|uniref:Uncharacterized protein n=1 Tax=Colletotrichum navitas TaxID=681940 RepID=A0AAD8Q9V0_9PEZI|nr:uncharacterized protein LY79DRAFT_407428 [Colletotrichum navitas]KAK1597194.1 hypothetical protein LY79DRAFT_407428 [Colletotrichum navitas]
MDTLSINTMCCFTPSLSALLRGGVVFVPDLTVVHFNSSARRLPLLCRPSSRHHLSYEIDETVSLPRDQEIEVRRGKEVSLHSTYSLLPRYRPTHTHTLSLSLSLSHTHTHTHTHTADTFRCVGTCVYLDLPHLTFEDLPCWLVSPPKVK